MNNKKFLKNDIYKIIIKRYNKNGDNMRVYHNFKPVINENSKILILGSFPSVKSRENNFYYGHRQNRFWKIISNIFNECLPETIENKINLILNNNLALWDVLASCNIHASEDSSIKNEEVNDITGLINIYNINVIIFNGNTAYKFYKKYFKNIKGVKEIVLPSTSPANARFDYEKLFEIWRESIIGNRS